MYAPPSLEVTKLLLDWSEGDTAALNKLIPLVHTGKVLKISTPTVEREWSLAQSWLLRELRRGRSK